MNSRAVLAVLSMLIGACPTFWCAPALADAAASLDLVPTTIAGTTMQVPRDWHRQMDEYSLLLTENPDQADTPVLALFAVAIQPGQPVTPAKLANQVLEQLDLPAHGIEVQLLEERPHGDALYRLHLLQDDQDFGYMASYSHADPNTGALVHMFFSATADRFLELGGPLLPLVVFGGLDPATLDQARRTASTEGTVSGGCNLADIASCGLGATLGAAAQPYMDQCGRSWNQAITDAQKAAVEAECIQSFQIASQISRMSHETTMKILYNSDSGWCYSGEADCY
ncbi:MAG: hypothetical protein Kow0020_14310 [Wenzhouxiangellaceae bacterium]